MKRGDDNESWGKCAAAKRVGELTRVAMLRFWRGREKDAFKK
jgi:hypothetical protein